MIKMTIPISLLLLSSISFADDVYVIKYSKESNCTVSKNSKSIELFDKRFEKKAPQNGYTCSFIRKEQYNDCKIISKKNITAQFFGYGVYEYTNLIVAFKSPDPSVESSIKVTCTKKIKN